MKSFNLDLIDQPQALISFPLIDMYLGQASLSAFLSGLTLCCLITQKMAKYFSELHVGYKNLGYLWLLGVDLMY